MVQFVTSNNHQSVPAKGQQVVLLAAYSGTAAVTGTTSARIGSPAAEAGITITLSNVTSVGGATITVQASNDGTTWTTLTAITSTVTTQTTYSAFATNTVAWQYYRANTAANASTNTMSVVLSF